MQHLLIDRLTKGDERSNATHFLHPSDVSKNGWCQRAAFYVVTGVVLDKTTKPRWRMGSVYEEGHMIHDKWQGWYWDLGILYGVFYCLHCQSSWWGTSPEKCQDCGYSREFLKYYEVPVHSDIHLMAGHGDGLARGVWQEYKSLGVNTLLFENPELLEDHTYRFNINGGKQEFIDYEGLWDAIRRPLPSHIRQGHLYVHMWNRLHPEEPVDEIAYIYECKWNQHAKEFIVRYRADRIQDRLDACLRIADAVRNNSQAPPCSNPGDDGNCPECKPYGDTRPVRSQRRLQRGVRENGGGHQESRPAGRFVRRAGTS